MHLYQWYIVVSAILIILEIFAAGFILLPIGLAGLCTAVVAYFRPELWLHAVFFICGSGLALLALGKFREQMNQKSPDPGVGPIGQTGVIVALPEGGRSFQVKVFGDVWEVVDNSLSSAQSAELQLGTSVKVTAVAGNKISIQKI
ncbi:MAG: hypothetical protein RL189_2055 [Pseudomonadota bacterium]|jgi:membrane protein implicated in regulation of membrane protease activity